MFSQKANMSRWTRKDSADKEDFMFCLYTILKINTHYTSSYIFILYLMLLKHNVTTFHNNFPCNCVSLIHRTPSYIHRIRRTHFMKIFMHRTFGCKISWLLFYGKLPSFLFHFLLYLLLISKIAFLATPEKNKN